MSYELRDHTADIAVAATGGSLEAVFAATADGLTAASSEEDTETHDGERFSISVTAENPEALLFDYLDQVIYLRDVRVELPVDHRVDRIETAAGDRNDQRWVLEASARGIPLSKIVARDVKAVTYSEMSLEQVEDGWEAYVVFDV
ncbi:archease [Natrarchaeobius halalkaliphilus]|uniref:Archease n=1 Tax=Natrarchaeobius halalkaliphilus TaxID=1679091 RepID=A0A3N6P725_9EURY|nr:archease [Natrarchaeobius halalkaliphilus]RQG91715.1 archease [Natrarchaeobius halalkaliphilus]